MKVKPLRHHVLVKLEKVERKSKHGIILATPKERDRQQAGGQITLVMDKGPDAFKGEELIPKVGDRVLCARYAGLQYNYDDDDEKLYRLVNDDEIAGIIKD